MAPESYLDTIILVAGGPSILSYRLGGIAAYGRVIGINDAFLKIDDCHVGITMDRLWMEARIDAVGRNGKRFYARYAATKFIKDKVRDTANITEFHCDETPKLATARRCVHYNGTSSGMVGLQYAVRENPKRIFMLGYDMQDAAARAHWYDAYAWAPQGATKAGRYKKWCDDFAQLARDIERREKVAVYNVNHRTALTCFPVIGFEEFLRRIMQPADQP